MHADAHVQRSAAQSTARYLHSQPRKQMRGAGANYQSSSAKLQANHFVSKEQCFEGKID
jgi:hypothetical protein